MDEQRIMDILQKVADQNGVPLSTVLEEINRVIDSGVDSPNPQIRAQWKRIPCRSAKPTAVELMAYLADRVMGELFLI